jgi:hypothetical protein
VHDITRLRIVKIVHTVAWAFFASCVLLILVATARGRPDLAAVLIGIVAIESLVLVVNGWRCPLTDVAARYTEDRRPNFDIYLPTWLAQYNKEIFGTLYVVGIVWTVIVWVNGER